MTSHAPFESLNVCLQKKELRKLKTVVMDAAAKPDATLFPEWEKIIFQYMDFTVLVSKCY